MQHRPLLSATKVSTIELSEFRCNCNLSLGQEVSKKKSKHNKKSNGSGSSKSLFKITEEETTASIMDFLVGFLKIESSCSWAFCFEGEKAPVVVNNIKYSMDQQKRIGSTLAKNTTGLLKEMVVFARYSFEFLL